MSDLRSVCEELHAKLRRAQQEWQQTAIQQYQTEQAVALMRRMAPVLEIFDSLTPDPMDLERRAAGGGPRLSQVEQLTYLAERSNAEADLLRDQIFGAVSQALPLQAQARDLISKLEQAEIPMELQGVELTRISEIELRQSQAVLDAPSRLEDLVQQLLKLEADNLASTEQ